MNFSNTSSCKASSSTIILSTSLKESVIKQLQDRLEFVWSEVIKYVLFLTSVSYMKLFSSYYFEKICGIKKSPHFSWLCTMVVVKDC